MPISKKLIGEAVDNASEFELSDKTVVRVMSPEYLVAIMLDTGRHKDYLRIDIFLQHEVVNLTKLQNILNEHDLIEKWQENISRFQL